MLNSIAIQGRLVHTPEAKVTKSGKDVCTFSIACDRQSGGQKETDFFNCTREAVLICRIKHGTVRFQVVPEGQPDSGDW